MGANRFVTTRFTAGGLDPNSIVDLLGPTDDQIPSWSQQGVVIGVVTNNEQVAGDGMAGPGGRRVHVERDSERPGAHDAVGDREWPGRGRPSLPAGRGSLQTPGRQPYRRAGRR